jgi:1-acyl-sn-glycerol-3-phosphate acyltransferase
VKSDDPLARYSAWRLALFGRYAERYFSRHFNTLRVAKQIPAPKLLSYTILFANHPAWWDPMVLLLFATRRWPHYRVFAPIDAAALARYSALAQFGLFPLAKGHSGARRFLDVANRVLAEPDAALALTPQGRLTDSRVRPIRFEPGLARLLFADPLRRAIPVALEYAHWSERLPEALVGFGTPVQRRRGETLERLHTRLEAALAATVDGLAATSARRDDSEFDVVIESRHRGVGMLYDAYERWRAARQGRAFQAAHRALED